MWRIRFERRGPGEVYGNRQSGIPQFKVAKLTDFEILRDARKVAKDLLNRDNSDVEKIKKQLFK
jgi:ATP-dependent DNA helicase RecG